MEEESSDDGAEIPPYTKDDLIKESESDDEEAWAGFEEPEKVQIEAEVPDNN